MPVPPDATDAELVIRAAEGEQAAFTMLFERNVDVVHDHLARWSQDATLAAEATRAAFVAALDALDSLRGERSPRAWLLRTARDHAVARLRQTSAGTEPPDNPVPTSRLAALLTEPGTAREVAASTHQTAESIWDAAAGLDAQSFGVLDLDVRQRLSAPELAQVLDTTPQGTDRLVREVRDRTETLFTAVLLLRAPMRDCPDLEVLRSGAPEPVDLTVARRVLDHASTCVTCGPRRARVVAPLRTYSAFARVRAPLPVRTTVAAAADRHFGAVATTVGRTRRTTAVAAALGLVLVATGVAIATLAPPPPASDDPPAVVAEPMTPPSPTPPPSPTAAPTLDVLPEVSPEPSPGPSPTVTPEPSPSPSPEPSPSPKPSPEPSPSPAPTPVPTPEPSPDPSPSPAPSLSPEPDPLPGA